MGTVQAPRVELKPRCEDAPEIDRCPAHPGDRIRSIISPVCSGELWCTSRWRLFLPTAQLRLDPERGGYT